MIIDNYSSACVLNQSSESIVDMDVSIHKLRRRVGGNSVNDNNTEKTVYVFIPFL
jgi:hypothetical protein